MNKTNLIGRLTKEPNITYATTEYGQMAIARFTLAVDRPKKRDVTDYISCKALGVVAEVIEKYVRKGYRVGVSGHIETGSYQNKDGNTVYTTEVMIEDIDLLEPKHDDQPATNDTLDNIGNDFNFGF